MKAMEKAMYEAVKNALIDNLGHRIDASECLGICYRTMTNYLGRWPELREFVVNYNIKEDDWPDNEMTRRYKDD